jgi:hypothetical protein
MGFPRLPISSIVKGNVFCFEVHYHIIDKSQRISQVRRIAMDVDNAGNLLRFFHQNWFQSDDRYTMLSCFQDLDCWLIHIRWKVVAPIDEDSIGSFHIFDGVSLIMHGILGVFLLNTNFSSMKFFSPKVFISRIWRGLSMLYSPLFCSAFFFPWHPQNIFLLFIRRLSLFLLAALKNNTQDFQVIKMRFLWLFMHIKFPKKCTFPPTLRVFLT